MTRDEFESLRQQISKGGPETLKCSFCGMPQAEVDFLVAGSAAYICNTCAYLAVELLEGGMAKLRVKNFTRKLRETE
jgi:ATP-dependent Clp protease ATP-binding subunit ClpX